MQNPRQPAVLIDINGLRSRLASRQSQIVIFPDGLGVFGEYRPKVVKSTDMGLPAHANVLRACETNTENRARGVCISQSGQGGDTRTNIRSRSKAALTEVTNLRPLL